MLSEEVLMQQCLNCWLESQTFCAPWGTTTTWISRCMVEIWSSVAVNPWTFWVGATAATTTDPSAASRCVAPCGVTGGTLRSWPTAECPSATRKALQPTLKMAGKHMFNLAQGPRVFFLWLWECWFSWKIPCHGKVLTGHCHHPNSEHCLDFSLCTFRVTVACFGTNWNKWRETMTFLFGIDPITDEHF